MDCSSDQKWTEMNQQMILIFFFWAFLLHVYYGWMLLCKCGYVDVTDQTVYWEFYSGIGVKLAKKLLSYYYYLARKDRETGRAIQLH